MKSLVSAELLKLRGTRSAWLPLIATAGYAVLAVVATTSMAGHGGNPALSAAWLPELMRGSGGLFVDGAVLLTGIILSAGEFRHRTSVTTFLGEPRRLRRRREHRMGRQRRRAARRRQGCTGARAPRRLTPERHAAR